MLTTGSVHCSYFCSMLSTLLRTHCGSDMQVPQASPWTHCYCSMSTKVPAHQVQPSRPCIRRRLHHMPRDDVSRSRFGNIYLSLGRRCRMGIGCRSILSPPAAGYRRPIFCNCGICQPLVFWTWPWLVYSLLPINHQRLGAPVL